MVRTAVIGVLLAVAIEAVALLLLTLGKAGPCGPIDFLVIAGLFLHLPCAVAILIFEDWLPKSAPGVMLFAFVVQVAFFICITIPLIPPVRALRAKLRETRPSDQPPTPPR